MRKMYCDKCGVEIDVMDLDRSLFANLLKSKTVTKKYHIHIYKVIGKLEKDIKSTSPEQAKSDALTDVCNGVEFSESDCKYIAMDFEHD